MATQNIKVGPHAEHQGEGCGTEFRRLRSSPSQLGDLKDKCTCCFDLELECPSEVHVLEVWSQFGATGRYMSL